MRERNEIGAGRPRSGFGPSRNPDLDVLTFEHLEPRWRRHTDEVRTFAELSTNAATGSRPALVARGMAPGDRFALMMRNHPEFVETMIAASITGCVFVPIDPRTKGEKLAYMLRNAGCRGVVMRRLRACASWLSVRRLPTPTRLVAGARDPARTALAADR